jgi:hypothetical protein
MIDDPRDRTALKDEEQWWRGWWAQDYSWDQLAAKPLARFRIDDLGHHTTASTNTGAGGATQQDLWSDAKLIPEFDAHGRLLRQWTPAHLPLTFENGTPAKSQWTEAEWLSMEEDVAERIRKLAKTEAIIQLEGLVLRRLLGNDQANVFYARTLFIQGIAAELHCQSASFHKSLFLDVVNLDGSNFECGASFEGTLFKAEASFRDVDFGPYAQFGRARFKAAVGFQRSKAELLSLSKTYCVSTMALSWARIGKVYVRGAHLNSLHAEAIQADYLNLSLTKIDGSVRIRNSHITEIVASSLEVADRMDMGHTEVDSIRLYNCLLRETGQLTSLKCRIDAVFTAVRFMGLVVFAEARFGQRSDFSSAIFEKAARFDDAKWPDGERVAGAFRDAVFHRLADFRGETPPSPAAFDGCAFRGEARFDRPVFAGDRLFKASLRSAQSEATLESLENGCRALKLAAEAVRDRLSEQRFHRYELICRRRSKLTPRSERFFSSIYGVAGDYGGSVTRPLVNLAALWLVMGLAFAFWGAALASAPIPPPDLLVQGIETAGRNIFNPLGIWLRPAAASQCIPGEIESALTSCSGPGPRLAFRLVSTVEALTAGVLIFLAGLAIKRRFQIT